MGIYFHIPFCAQACHYCDFHFSTSLKYKSEMLQAMIAELEQRQHEIQHPIETIYFGGGTPSLLSAQEINKFITKIQQRNHITKNCEITLEANPDNLTKNYLNELKTTPINRLSIGTQSFFNEDLQWMNRAHNADQAISSIKQAQDIGFSNITIDLIYGSPTTSAEQWLKNLEQWKNLNIPHLSAYCLTVEENTALHHKIKMNQVQSPTDEHSIEHFNLLMKFVKENNINHYEISNFCKEDNYSKHNTNYWFSKPYLGIGPSAHSFDGQITRRWNIANNLKYIKAIQTNQNYFEQEHLSKENQINEYILTRLRTKWGINRTETNTRFGDKLWNQFLSTIESNKEYYTISAQSIQLNQKGKLFADGLAAELFS